MNILLKNFSIGLIFYVISIGLSLLNAKFLVYSGGVELYADFSYWITIINFSIPFISFGLPTFLLINSKKYFSNNLFGKISVITIFFSIVPASLYSLKFDFNFILYITIIAYCILNYYTVLSKKKENLIFHWFLKYFIKPGSIFIVLIFSVSKIENLYTYTSLIIFVILILFYKPVIFNSFKKRNELGLIKAIKNSKSFYLNATIPVIFLYFDKIILIDKISEIDYGTYQLLFKFSLFAGVPLLLLNSIFTKKIVEETNEKLKIHFRLFRLKSTLYSSIIAFGLILFSKYIFMFYEIQYITENILLFVLLLVVQVTSSAFGSVGIIASYKGLQKSVAIILFFTAIFHILLLLLIGNNLIKVVSVLIITTFIWNFLINRLVKNEILK